MNNFQKGGKYMKNLKTIGTILLLLTSILALGCVEKPGEKIIPPTVKPTEVIEPTEVISDTSSPQAPSSSPVPIATEQMLKELTSGMLYIRATMETPSYWGDNKYMLEKLEVDIRNQNNVPISVLTQVMNDGNILEEKSFDLKEGQGYSFSNERKYTISGTDVILRISIPGYVPKEYKFLNTS